MSKNSLQKIIAKVNPKAIPKAKLKVTLAAQPVQKVTVDLPNPKKEPITRENTLLAGITLLEPYAALDTNGNLFGFDIMLTNKMAEVAGFKRIIYSIYTIPFQPLSAGIQIGLDLVAGVIDVIAISTASISSVVVTLHNSIIIFSGTATNGTMYFPTNKIPSYISNSFSAFNDLVTFLKSPGNKTVVGATESTLFMLRTAGVSPSQLINVYSHNTIQDLINLLTPTVPPPPNQCNILFLISDPAFDDAIVATAVLEGKPIGPLGGVPLSLDRIVLGFGFVVNKLNCKLATRLESAYDKVVCTGDFQNFVYLTSLDDRFALADRTAFAVEAFPVTPDYSIINGFIPVACVHPKNCNVKPGCGKK